MEQALSNGDSDLPRIDLRKLQNYWKIYCRLHHAKVNTPMMYNSQIRIDCTFVLQINVDLVMFYPYSIKNETVKNVR